MEELLTVKQVSGIFRIPEQAVYGLVARRRIPSIRFSTRGITFRVEDFEAWLRSKTITDKDQRRAYVFSEESKGEEKSHGLDS